LKHCARAPRNGKGKYTELDTTIKTRESKGAKRMRSMMTRFGRYPVVRPDVSDFAIDGFELALRQQYKPDFYRRNAQRTLDKDGKIVMDPTKAQTFRSMSDIAKELAEKEKLIGGEVKPVLRNEHDQYYRSRTGRHDHKNTRH
jgi:hypothetical protein